MTKLEPVVTAVLLCGVWLALGWIPIPGLDRIALASDGSVLLGLTVGGMSVASLALLHAVVDAVSTDRLAPYARGGALLLYLGGWAIAAVSTAIALESHYASPVLSPGLSFQVVFTACIVGAVAVAWAAARSLDRIGLDGAFLLLLPEFLMWAWTWHGAVFEGLQAGFGSPLDLLTSPLVPFLAVAALLAVRSPRWPMPVVGRLVLRTPLPLLLLPYALGTIADASAIGFVWPGISTAMAWVGVLLVGVVIRRAEPGPYRGAWIALSAVVAVVLLALAAPLVAHQVQQLQPRFAGGATVIVEADYEGALSPRDLDTLDLRLARVGSERELVQQTAQRIQITVEGADPVEATEWLERVGTRSGSLGIHRVADLSEAEFRQYLTGADPQEPDTWPEPPAGLLWGAEACDDDALPQSCRAYLLYPPELGGRDLSGAEVVFDPQFQQPEVRLTFTPEAAGRFGAMTEELVDHKIAITLDGRVLTAPVVKEPIHGGQVVVNMGRGDFEELQQQADDLVDQLHPGGLDAGSRTAFRVVSLH